MKVELGVTIEDSITGFTGIVTARCEYITGCHQLLVQPRVKNNGDFVESRWFDEDRCKQLPGDGVEVGYSALLEKMKRTTVNPGSGFDKPAPRR
jgi:hypothetical protein